MKQNLTLAAVAAGLLFSQSRAPGAEAQTGRKVRTPVDWVNPLVDTHNSRWFYFNSACRPFGMVNLSPDTRTKGSWKSGYLYADNHIRCFSHIHAWELSGIPVLPITGPMIGHQGMDAYRSEFSHDDEVVRPGYHKVALRTYGVTAELTSTLRVGFHRYTFPVGRESYVLFDVGAYLAQGPMVRAEVRRASDTEIEGMSLMGATLRRKKETPVFFVARFSEPMTDFGGWQKGQLLPKGKSVAGPQVGAFVRFAPRQPLLMKVAISYTSVEHARKNLEAELDHWDFDRIVAESAAEWNAHLSRIQVEGGTDAERTKFYTDLWRAMLGRRVLSDAAGSYMDMTGDEPRVRCVPLDAEGRPEFNMHNFDAWWGSHWSLDILWPLLCPERYRDFCLTSLEMFKNGGLIPRGPSGGNYTFVMIGDSAAPALTAAYQKGIRDFDAKLILQGLVRNTGADGGRYHGGYAPRPSPNVHAEYERKGYVSWGNFLGGMHNKAVSSLTLYNAYHDWCIAQLARSLNEQETYEKFIPGAANYRNVLWPEKQCAWVRMPDGSWKDGFQPVDDLFEQDGFCEVSAAISTFYVPHDPDGLAEYLGGAKALAAKLDGYFQQAEPLGFIGGKHNRKHASTYVCYSNQDGTGMAHFFNRIGHPWLAQKWVRKVHAANFSGCDPFNGYNGDEDQGQMASLSALMAMGLFQFDGGSGPDSQYDLTAPVFDKVTIRLSDRYYGGNTFTIVARNQGPRNYYIQSAKWNGEPWSKSLLPHAELVSGGTLELTLGPEPAKSWGSKIKLEAGRSPGHPDNQPGSQN